MDNGFEFELYSDYAVLARYSGDDTDVVIPDTVSGLPVTSIGEIAFSYCTSLTSVDISMSTDSIKIAPTALLVTGALRRLRWS